MTDIDTDNEYTDWETVQGGWLKWTAPGQQIVGIVRDFKKTGGTQFDSDKVQPSLVLEDAQGEVWDISMNTSLRKQMERMSPNIVENETLIRILFKKEEPHTKPGFNPVKVMESSFLNPGMGPYAEAVKPWKVDVVGKKDGEPF